MQNEASLKNSDQEQRLCELEETMNFLWIGLRLTFRGMSAIAAGDAPELREVLEKAALFGLTHYDLEQTRQKGNSELLRLHTELNDTYVPQPVLLRFQNRLFERDKQEFDESKGVEEKRSGVVPRPQPKKQQDELEMGL